MPLASRRLRRSSIDIWPGFVDALAQLLMVIIFMLLVFTAGQFLLSDALSGRDQALQELQQQVNELAQPARPRTARAATICVPARRAVRELKTALAERDQLSGKLRDAERSSAPTRKRSSCNCARSRACGAISQP